MTTDFGAVGESARVFENHLKTNFHVFDFAVIYMCLICLNMNPHVNPRVNRVYVFNMFRTWFVKLNVKAFGRFSKVLKHIKVEGFQVFDSAVFSNCYFYDF